MASYGPEVIAALRVVLDDLAHGRLTGKALGVRHGSGDLTGLASVKCDLPDSPTRRFRLVYAEPDASTRGLLAVGVRDEHAIYSAGVRTAGGGENLGGRVRVTDALQTNANSFDPARSATAGLSDT